jgi:hypothetical protein
MNIIYIPHKLRIEVIALLSFLCLIPYAFADEASGFTASSWESRRYLMEGVYYLINEGDRDVAEGLFRKAIISSPFSSLSMEAEDQGNDRQVVAEAFYFLGRIHYEKALLGTGKENHEKSIENITWAKSYLEKAEEYGIVHDRLHPPLIDQINRKYPEISMPNLETNPDKVRVAIEIEHGESYKVDAVKVDQYTSVTDNRFLTNKEFDMECGARYKVKPDVQGSYKSINRTLAVLGIALVIWFTRG